MAKLITESITLSFITDEENLFDKTIPFSSICSLSFFDVQTDIGHTNEGEFLEFFTALVTDLRIYKDKIDNSLVDILNKYSIISINLNFTDKSCKAYNVRWKSDNSVKNDAQVVEDSDNVLLIKIA